MPNSLPESEPAPTQLPTLRRYSFLGPAGTFTEAALAQVPEAVGQIWVPVPNVPAAVDDVVSGRSDAAMIAIENSVDGGVTVAQDTLAAIPGIRIIGEFLVSVNFVLATRPGTRLDQVRRLNAHPVAYAQCARWLAANLPNHEHIPASSNVAAATDLFTNSIADAAIAPPNISSHAPVAVLAEQIGDNPSAQTRFVLVSRTVPVPERTGADKTSLIVELPADDSGALLNLLEQFAARGVNLTLIQSRPIGDQMGRYRFVVDVEGHLTDERVADALLGVKRFSPRVTFLGSYPRADRQQVTTHRRYDDSAFAEARAWLDGLSG